MSPNKCTGYTERKQEVSIVIVKFEVGKRYPSGDVGRRVFRGQVWAGDTALQRR